MERAEAGFVHLRVHTEYSSRQAVCRLEELLRTVRSWGMTSVAITDKEAIHGAVRFYELAKRYGIHPVIGCEADTGGSGEPLILLAATNRGFERIVEYLNGAPDVRRPFHALKHLSKGDIIALSGGRYGRIGRLLAEGKTEQAKAKALEYAKIFGEGNFYLEVQHHGPDDLPLIGMTERLSRETGIPLAATHDVRYIRSEHATLLSLLQGDRAGNSGGPRGERGKDSGGPRVEPDENNRRSGQQIKRDPFTGNAGSPPAGTLYFPSPQEMAEKFRDLPEALANTVMIASRCRVAFEPLNAAGFPHFPVPEPHLNEEQYLASLCREALTRQSAALSMNPDERRQAEERLAKELDLIRRRGLASYILIVWDIVRYAKERGIAVGPGRGSAACSLVAFLLGITKVNPLRFGLLFERFLSEDRAGLPDIDLDVCQIRRHELLQYVIEKYGEDRVAHIGVWNTFGTRGAVREAGKFMGLPQERLNVLAKLLPALSGTGGIRHCLTTLPELQRLQVSREPYRTLFALAESLEGLPRNQGAHPSGILIGPRDLKRLVPLKRRPNGLRMTAYTKEDVKQLGLLKLDLLGSRILTVIQDTIRFVRESGEILDLERIPLDDPKTFRVLSEGDTLGCFQLESMGMRSLLRRMKPQQMEDLTALLALYRPGAGDAEVMGTFMRRRLGRERADVLLPELKPILAPTYGLILYQEQVMEIAHAAAGYTMGEAYQFMRALMRNSGDDLQHHRERFAGGSAQRGIERSRALEVFDFIARFAGYSFPKAHAVPYALLTYWTVYLKTYYPIAYMASLLSLPGGYYEPKAYLRETAKMGIPLLRPDINRSGFGYCPEEEGIRVGLDAVYGCGPEAAAAVIRSRRKDGLFASLPDFVARMKACRIGSQALRGWIASGACDGFGIPRRAMLAMLDDANGRAKLDNANGRAMLAELDNHANGDAWLNEAAQRQSREEDDRMLEKKALGFPLHPVPSERWKRFVRRCGISDVGSLLRTPGHTRVRICGSVVASRRHRTEDGDYSLSLAIQDLTGMVEVILYPDTYKACLYELNPGAMMIEGVVRNDQGAVRLIAQKVRALPSA